MHALARTYIYICVPTTHKFQWIFVMLQACVSYMFQICYIYQLYVISTSLVVSRFVLYLMLLIYNINYMLYVYIMSITLNIKQNNVTYIYI